MSHAQVGSCPRCGAPVYAESPWHGITPPPSRPSCGCAGGLGYPSEITTTPNTGVFWRMPQSAASGEPVSAPFVQVGAGRSCCASGRRGHDGSGIRVNLWAIVSRAVEEGIDYGVMRAYKHSEDPPDQQEKDRIAEAIFHGVMNELCEVIEFGDTEGV